MPSSVRPWRSIVRHDRRGGRAVADGLGLLGGMGACAIGSRVKSWKRSAAPRSGTRRAHAGAGRAVDDPTGTASGSWTSAAPAPSACCVPMDRRHADLHWHGSRLWTSAWSLRPAARPTRRDERRLGDPGDLADARDPWSCSNGGGGPAPHSLSTGSRCRRASSPPGGTSGPSGLAGRSPPWPGTSSAPPDRDGQTAALEHLAAQPRRCRAATRDALEPRTSRRASSIDGPSTSGDVSAKISNTALLAAE